MKIKLFLSYIFCLALSLPLLLQAQELPVPFDYGSGGEYEIAAIRVEGAKFLDAKILATLSGLAVGDKIKVPGEAIPKAIKTLWRQRLFTDITIHAEKIEAGKMYLVIYVEERPRVSRYSLKGLKNGESEELRKKLDLRAGQIFTENLRSITINTCKNYFTEKGFLATEVNVEEVPDTLLTNSIIVKIGIKKGARVKIDQINVYGNRELPESKLKKQLKDTHEKIKFDLDGLFRFKKNFARDSIKVKWYQIPGNLSVIRAAQYASRHINLNVFKSSKFKKDKYEDDKKKMIDFYNTKGFRDAKIIRDSVYLVNGKNLQIDITVDEGRKYYFRNIFYNGNTKYPDSLLNKIVNIKKGEVYNQKVLDERIFMNPNGGDLSSL
jgi:outer membrane protein insertion porin family